MIERNDFNSTLEALKKLDEACTAQDIKILDVKGISDGDNSGRRNVVVDVRVVIPIPKS